MSSTEPAVCPPALEQQQPKSAKKLEKDAKKQAKLEKFQQKEQQKKLVTAENDKTDVSLTHINNSIFIFWSSSHDIRQNRLFCYYPLPLDVCRKKSKKRKVLKKSLHMNIQLNWERKKVYNPKFYLFISTKFFQIEFITSFES